jgi:hypothetical protein
MSVAHTNNLLHTFGQLAAAKAGAARAADAALAARPGKALASAQRTQSPAPIATPPGGAGKVPLPRGSIVNLLV